MAEYQEALSDPRKALELLAKRHPHSWAPADWHLRRIRRYLAQLKSQITGEKNIDCQALAARCRKDSGLSEANEWKRFYKDLAELFERASDGRT
jgi:sugar phosphate isomerase/epimerase